MIQSDENENMRICLCSEPNTQSRAVNPNEYILQKSLRDTHTHTHTHTQNTHTDTDIHTHGHTYTQIQTFTHTCTHTHTNTITRLILT